MACFHSGLSTGGVFSGWTDISRPHTRHRLPFFLHVLFSFAVNSFLFSFSPLSVSDTSGVRRRRGPGREPAGPHRVPDLHVLLLQEHRRGHQEARDLLRHLGRRHRRPHHVVGRNIVFLAMAARQNQP